jgi:hypothetical protein
MFRPDVAARAVGDAPGAVGVNGLGQIVWGDGLAAGGADIVADHAPAAAVLVCVGVYDDEPDGESGRPAAFFLGNQPAMEQVSFAVGQKAAAGPGAAVAEVRGLAGTLRQRTEKGGQFIPVAPPIVLAPRVGGLGVDQQGDGVVETSFSQAVKAADREESGLRPGVGLPAVGPEQAVRAVPVRLVMAGGAAVETPIVDVADSAGVQAGPQRPVLAVGQGYPLFVAVVPVTISLAAEGEWVAAVLEDHGQDEVVAAGNEVAAGAVLQVAYFCVQAEACIPGSITNGEVGMAGVV